MAASIFQADRFPDADYSIPHRSPPPVPSVADTAEPQPPPHPQQASSHHQHHQRQLPSASAADNQQQDPRRDAGAVEPERGHRRRGSFGSFLRRSSSRASQGRTAVSPEPADVDSLPALPKTRIAQAQAHAAASNEPRSRSDVPPGRGSGEGARMLRKSSAMRKEKERQAQEAERAARMKQPPPRLPSATPLPAIASFGGDAVSSSTDTTLIPSASHPVQNTAATANFSRPKPLANGAMASSSSPAYAARAAASSVTSSPPDVRYTAGEYVYDPVQRTESMTNRSRYSYANSVAGVDVNSPRRIRRRKDPTPFNVLVIGAKNCGKTSFISFLRHSLALDPAASPFDEQTLPNPSSSFIPHYLDTEIDGERVGLTLWDSAGLEKHIIDLQLREMVAFVESKFQDTFAEEQKVMRSPGVLDTHIHCVLLILDPVRLDSTVAASMRARGNNTSGPALTGLDTDLDLQIMRVLWGKTTVIPIISKADTLTAGHVSFLKRAVWESVKGAKLDPLEAMELEDELENSDEGEEEEGATGENTEDDHDTASTSSVVNNLSVANNDPDQVKLTSKPRGHNRQSSGSMRNTLTSTSDDPSSESPYIPMSILSPDPYDLPPYAKTPPANKPIGRRFPWGFADPHNANHCDFTRLRDSVFSEWRSELRDLSRTTWYENWRTSRLKSLPAAAQPRTSKTGAGVVGKNAGRISAADVGGDAKLFPNTAGVQNGNAAVPRSVSGPVVPGGTAVANAQVATSVGKGEARTLPARGVRS